MSNSRPWENEPNDLDFEAEGLRCAMRRNEMGAWCGYVGVGHDHPLFGLPYNHPLKLPMRWFERRKGLQGTGIIDLFLHAYSGKEIDEACPISLAFEVHGGVTWADGELPRGDGGDLWWFGFDCGHAGDLVPRLAPYMRRIHNSLPEKLRRAAERFRDEYRDQQYVVSECQSLAAQLVAIAELIRGGGDAVDVDRLRPPN